MVAVAVLGIVGLVLVQSFSMGVKATMNSRLQLQATHLASRIQSRMLNVNFDDIFAVDSANKTPDAYPSVLSPSNYLINWDISRISSTLSAIESDVLNAGFSRFKIEITYLRRDSADSDGDLSVVDYIPFKSGDWSAKPCSDTNDPAVKFQNLCGHGGSDIANFTPAYDTGLSASFWDVCRDNVTGAEVPEVPDTRSKLLKITIMRKDEVVVVKQGDVISREQFTGKAGASIEAPLKLRVTSPSPYYCIYSRQEEHQRASRDLSILPNVAPTDTRNPYWRRVDTYDDPTQNPRESYLFIAGESDPGNTVRGWFKTLTGTMGESSTVVPGNGLFSLTFPALSTPGTFSQDGWPLNIVLRAYSPASGLTSPIVYGRWFGTDTTPPFFAAGRAPADGATVTTRAPYAYVEANDPCPNPSGTALNWNSGIRASTAWEDSNMKWIVNGSTVPTIEGEWQLPGCHGWYGARIFHPVTPGWIDYQPTGVWSGFDFDPKFPRIWPDGDYSVIATAIDDAGYKTSTTWNFSVAVPADTTPPVILHFGPPDGTHFASADSTNTITVLFSDLESGVNYRSLRVHLEQTVGPPGSPAIDVKISTAGTGPFQATRPNPSNTADGRLRGVYDGLQDKNSEYYRWTAPVGVYVPSNHFFYKHPFHFPEGTYHVELYVENSADAPASQTLSWDFVVDP